MSRYSPDTRQQLAAARRAKGMSQSALARAAGCTQSAVSMFEKGETAKVADATIEKMAELLGVTLAPAEPEGEPAAAAPVAPAPPPLPAHGFCPNCSCPSNVPYTVDGAVIFRPVRAIASPNGGHRCAACGEVLETRCPACGAPLNDGACCAVCGAPYVTAVLPEGADAAAWAHARRAEIRELRELTK